MLNFHGTAYTKDADGYEFSVKALSEKEAIAKVKANFKARKKPIKIAKVDLEDVDIVPKGY